MKILIIQVQIIDLLNVTRESEPRTQRLEND